MTDKTLNLFFGREPSEEFLKDIEILKKLSEKEVFRLIDKIIEWYPKERDINKEVEEWLNKFTKEKKNIGDLIDALAFIFRLFASGIIDEKELRDDIKKINFSEKYFDYFLKKLPEAKEFRKKAIRQRQPYRNFIDSVDWRIDKQNYDKDFGENICILEITYYSKGKKEIARFELSLEGIKILKTIFNKIEEKLCTLK